jgi:hypothetical protein
VLEDIRATVEQLTSAGDERLASIGTALTTALALQEQSTQWVLQALKDNRTAAMGASFEYMMQTGYLFGGWHMARSALVALERARGGSDNPFYEAKIATTRFYAEQILPRCAAHAGAVTGADGTLVSYPQEWI